MKIALLASGAVIHTLRWAEGLTRAGFEVELFSLEPVRSDAGITSPVPSQPLPALPLPMFVRYPAAAFALRRRLKRFRPDLVDAHFVPNYGLLGALTGRHPLVIHCWGSDLLLGDDFFRKARARWILDRADRVYCDAENLARAARALGVPSERLRVQPWGIDTRAFAYVESANDKAELRRERVGGEIGPLVISTRTLDPLYDVATLVEAWAVVRERRPQARLWIVGDGPERSHLEALAASNGAAETIRFTGRLRPAVLSQYLSLADLYVSTSQSDSTSLSLLEAMSAGCYPVVSDIEGNREWVDESRARLFPVGDADALARHLLEGLGRDELASARRSNRLLVESRGDWSRTLETVATDYGELVRSIR